MNTAELELDQRNREYLAAVADFMPREIVEDWSTTIGDTRESATAGVLTIWARQSWFTHAHKSGSNLTNLDVTPVSRRGIQTETLKGLFFMSPSRHYVYQLKPVTVKGVKMLKVGAWLRGEAVVSFEVKS